MNIIELSFLGVVTLCIIAILVMQSKIYLSQKKRTDDELMPTPRLIDGIRADLHRLTHNLSLSLEQLESREKIASQQLSEINDLLKAKGRTGKVTEIVLDALIGDRLPRDIYQRGYYLPDGNKLNMALILKEEIVPIDTDFPLESYKKMLRADEKEKSRLKKGFLQEVKSRIDSLSAKYIESRIANINLVIMYIPSEEVYYEILTQTELTDYGQKKMIYLTSPQTLSSFVDLIIASLRDRKMRKNLEEMFDILNRVR